MQPQYYIHHSLMVASALFIFAVAATSRAAVETINLSGPSVTEDAVIFEELPDHNGGAGDSWACGRTAGSTNPVSGTDALSRRAFIRFDLSGIPANSLIMSAELDLEVLQGPIPAVPSVHSLHRVLGEWTEGTTVANPQGGAVEAGAVSWNSAVNGSVDWTTPGGDFLTTPSAELDISFTNGLKTWSGPQLTADIQAWIDGTLDNNGWILIGDESQLRTARIFASATAIFGMPPTLRIQYIAPTEITGEAVTADASIYSNDPDGNTGGDSTMRVGRTNGGSNRRGLIRYDLSSIGAGMEAMASELALDIVQVSGGAVEHSVHRVTASWVEGTGIGVGGTGGGSEGTEESGSVTWDSREHETTLWATAGGDFMTTPSTTLNVGTSSGPVTFSGSGLDADVNAWLDGSVENNGWLIIGDESQGGSARGYRASEASSGALPLLRLWLVEDNSIPSSYLELR